jgi:hypothetical protein
VDEGVVGVDVRVLWVWVWMHMGVYESRVWDRSCSLMLRSKRVGLPMVCKTSDMYLNNCILTCFGCCRIYDIVSDV